MSVEIHEIAKKMNGKQLEERMDHIAGVIGDRRGLADHVRRQASLSEAGTRKAGRILAYIMDVSLPMLEYRWQVFVGEKQDNSWASQRLGHIVDDQRNLVSAAADFHRGLISQEKMTDLQQAYVKKAEQVIATPSERAYSPEGFERRLLQKLNPYRRTEEKPASNS
jgi:hypothetical protein